MSRLRNHIFLLLAAAIGALLIVQYLRLLKPAQARAVVAACNGLRPSATNPVFGPMNASVMAPDFKLKDIQGQERSLSEFRGKTVIVNFWASWCSVCRSEKPSLESFQEEYSKDKLMVLAVASDEDWAPVRRAMMGFEVTTAQDVLDRPELFGVRDPSLLPAQGTQVVVARVERGRTAASVGMRRLQRIISANGVELNSPAQFDEILRSGGDTISLTVTDGKTTKTLTLKEKSPLYVLIDPPSDGGNLGTVAKSYGITAVPESFIIGPEGRIRHYFINKRNWLGDITDTCLSELING